MSVKEHQITVALTSDQAAELARLCAKFKLTEAEVLIALARFGLSLTSTGDPVEARSLEEYLNVKVSDQQALGAAAEQAFLATQRVSQSFGIGLALISARLAQLPEVAPTGDRT